MDRGAWWATVQGSFFGVEHITEGKNKRLLQPQPWEKNGRFQEEEGY